MLHSYLAFPSAVADTPYLVDRTAADRIAGKEVGKLLAERKRIQ